MDESEDEDPLAAVYNKDLKQFGSEAVRAASMKSEHEVDWGEEHKLGPWSEMTDDPAPPGGAASVGAVKVQVEPKPIPGNKQLTPVSTRMLR